MCRVRKIACIILHAPAHECKSRNEICREYRLAIALLLQELRRLERSGEVVVLLKGSRWGTSPAHEEGESVVNWEQFKCELCGVRYCAPQSM